MFVSNKNANKLFASKQNTAIAQKKLPPSDAKTLSNNISAMKTALQLQLNDPATTPDTAKVLTTQLQQLNGVIEEDEQLKELQWNQDFDKWLIGRGREEDHARTPWQRTPLTTLPGVRDYLEPKITQHYDYMKFLEKLQMSKPINLQQARLYYKYIVRGGEDGLLESLNEWSLVQMDELDKIRLGKETVDKLNAYIFKKDPIKAEWDSLASDFTDYIQIEYAANEVHKNYLRRRFSSKQEILSQLMTHPDKNKVNTLMKQYMNTTSDFELVIKTHLNRRDELEAQKQLTISRFEELLAFNPHLTENEAAWGIFNSKLSSFDNEISELTQRTIDFWETQHGNITDMDTLLAHNIKNEMKTPQLVEDYLNGEDIDLTTHYMSIWQHLINNTLNMCDIQQAVAQFTWMYDGIDAQLLQIANNVDQILSMFTREQAYDT